MEKYPEDVITKGRKGTEIRALVSRGKYVICNYLDPETLKPTEEKYKLMLKDENGNVEEYFLIPLKDERKLMIKPKKAEKKKRRVWNPKTGKAEELWVG